MNLRMGIASILSKAKSPLTLSAFGKLPFYMDFLRHRCFGKGETGDFASWIEAGFSHADRLGDLRHELGCPWRLLFSWNRRRPSVVAVIRDSVDMSGGRHFPFACYTVVERSDLGDLPADWVAAADPLWTRLELIMDDLSRAPDVDGFARIAAEASLDVEADPAFGSPAFADVIPRIMPLGHPIEGLISFLRPLSAAARDMASRRGQDVTVAPICFPLAEGIDTTRQAFAWLRFVESRGLDGISREGAVSIAFPTSGSRGPLWVVPREPQTRDFTLLGGARPSQEAESVPVAGTSDDDAQTLRTAIRKLLGDLGSPMTGLADLPI